MQKDDTCPKNTAETADQPWCLKTAPTSADQLVIGLASNIEEQRNRGKKLYALSVTYRQGRNFTISPEQAFFYFRRFHNDLLCYLANSKNISRSWFRALEPVIYVFVDLPFSKRKAAKVQPKSLHMSSLHHHCVVIANDEAHVKKLNALADDDDAARAFVQSLRDVCAVKTIKNDPIGDCLSDVIRWIDYSSSYALRSKNLGGLADHYQVLPISNSEHQNKNNKSGETSMIAKTNHHHQQPYEYEKRIDAGSRIITNRTRYLQSRYEAYGWNKRALLEHVFTRAAFVQSLSEFLVHCAAIGQNEARRAALRLAISAERTS